ncbi:hypothetical protein DPMN_084362 [Dreissena polymorpha]|uniref:Uncharacterized protein n=1 Tax=Dreissena polymorpha TaxID=45954 RepID=A0A9D3YBN0_DREPO|nr:hypothetical protein DPMN_084362 [Dreissena polymorpha]
MASHTSRRTTLKVLWGTLQAYCISRYLEPKGKVLRGDSYLGSWCKECYPVGGLLGKGWCQSLHTFIVHRRRHPDKVLKAFGSSLRSSIIGYS